MKRIGLVGGIGPESTVDYYQRIVRATAPLAPGVRPDVVIYGANMDELFALMEARDLSGVTAWLVARLEALAGAGAELAAITANTPHVVFDEVRARSPLPLRSIVEATRAEAVRLGLRRLALLGTAFTMAADFYPRVFREAGLEVVVPAAADQRHLHHRLMTEIELGVFKDSTRDELLEIVARVHRASPVDAVILGCTELPLILTAPAYPVPGAPRPLPFLDTTALHVADLLRAAG